MDYPLQIELDITQDDFITVEILEQELDRQLNQKGFLKAFLCQSTLLLAAAILIYCFRNVILWQSVYFVIFFEIIFAIHFIYNYFFGCKREFSLAVNHILQNRENHSFFSPENGFAFFYENRCEYLTNEQRRYFDYDKINNIKITKHLFIFVMKRSKEKNMRGFAYMVIPKRNMGEEQQDFLAKICGNIVEKYDLKPWVDSDIMG